MAFATKYRMEIADNLGIVWQVDIQEDAFAGEITTLQGSGSPLHFSYYGEDDIRDQIIMGSIAKLEVKCQSDFAYEELFTSDNQQFKVIIKQGATIHWTGYIQPNTWSEPYNQTPYSVTITACDGLAQLRDFKFIDLGYSERQITSQVIYDILALVGIDGFTEYVNLYESTMDSDVGDSPLDQSGIDPEVFAEADCYEALEEILKTFEAAIRQDIGGVFTIYRTKELKDATMYGRIFTDGTTKSATTKTPAQYINRTAQSSNFRDHEGGTVTTIPQLKVLHLNQDYGEKESILVNYNFPISEFDEAGECTGWVNDNDTSTSALSIAMPGEGEEGILMNDEDTEVNHYITQQVEVKATTDETIFEFEFGGLTSGSTATIFAQVILSNGVDTTVNLSESRRTGEWSEEEYHLVLACNKTFNDDLSLTTTKISASEIPFSGSLYVRLFAAVSTGGDTKAVFKKVSVYFVDAEGQKIEGIGYTVTNTVTGGKVVDREQSLGDGPGFDNDILLYKGALNVWDDTDPLSTSRSWATRGGSEDMPLAQLISEEIAGQYNRPKQLLQLPVYELKDDEFISLVGNIQDVINEYGGSPRIFAPSRADFDVKNRHWDINMTEIIA